MLVQRLALPGFGRDDVGREGRAFFFADELMRYSDKRQLLEIEEAHRGDLRESQRNSIYSERNACTGSTSAARRAGKRQAISAVAVSKTAARGPRLRAREDCARGHSNTSAPHAP